VGCSGVLFNLHRFEWHGPLENRPSSSDVRAGSRRVPFQHSFRTSFPMDPPSCGGTPLGPVSAPSWSLWPAGRQPVHPVPDNSLSPGRHSPRSSSHILLATEVDYIAQGHHHVSDRHGGSVCASLGPGRHSIPHLTRSAIARNPEPRDRVGGAAPLPR
jgi:hypothetical protein